MRRIVDVRPLMAFMRAHYSTERLCALLAHCQDGKFRFYSCCCFIGAATADHPLVSDMEPPAGMVPHFRDARHLPGAEEAESATSELAFTSQYDSCDDDHDSRIRRRLIPLIQWALSRREKAAAEAFYRPEKAVSVCARED